MLGIIIFLPVIIGEAPAIMRGLPAMVARLVWLAPTLIDLALLIAPNNTASTGAIGLRTEERVNWMPQLGSSCHLGADGLSLPLLLAGVTSWSAPSGPVWDRLPTPTDGPCFSSCRAPVGACSPHRT